MKNTSFTALGLLVITLLVVPACDWLQKTEVVVASEPMLRIIDVNTEPVFKDAHIDGAVHFDLDGLESASRKWNKDDTIIVYCSDYRCMESHRAAKMLSELGFKDVAVYAGGISEWYKLSQENSERYPLVGAGKMEFLRKETQIFIPEKEELIIVDADEVALQIKKNKK